ncbi:hypothetical protein GO988_17975 [Hymenobacter sp. HMF4947]|uniref:Lipoprotein n=1 Tax=Hymenobacter ginkgonis TaxID=2682976 RepID=A0A7K1TJ62_9BACT|nr:hypothetical protein [Hymenobacter ginkgonis]MVN78221.1 hypothetical protein [Hymenobacter ginkgonis]
MPRLLLIAALLVLAACHKKDTSPTLDFGPDDGISYRSNNGMANGAQDPTDWTSDATWNEQETALFPELSIALNSPQQPTLVGFTYTYPNPASRANWILQTNGSAVSYTVTAVLVNRTYQVVKRLEHGNFTGGHVYAFDYAQLGLNPNETYRLYYVLFNNNGLLYKGHGDIRYNQ